MQFLANMLPNNSLVQPRLGNPGLTNVIFHFRFLRSNQTKETYYGSCFVEVSPRKCKDYDFSGTNNDKKRKTGQSGIQ